MRHRTKTKKISRFSSHYDATMRSLARAMVQRQRIVTTRLKAKLARQTVDKLVSLGKESGSLAAKRRAFSILGDHSLVQRLFRDIAPMFVNLNGGYTRIIPYRRRRGDGAQMVVLEFSLLKTIAVPDKDKAQPTPQEKEIVKQQQLSKKMSVHAGEVAPPEKERHRKEAKKPTKRMLGGFGKIFKQERDAL